ncbi:hypothetical protein HN385_07590 [archaeon]|jgi:hypothetical protein|nr:hypothetical protein [archaeon]MBT4207436.1 hypothetical protein [Candidatus Woesearchaeota archaeon]MBT4732230.1 hypothetical protein [Candidatus Woesearchaeota archaeon]MBT7557261.1 hypothetical protein [Candidatus Woesearchaeota archaeon]
MPFTENKKSYLDSLFSISTLLKRWHTEIQNKDINKNYMIDSLNKWIKKLEKLRHEIMMGKSK